MTVTIRAVDESDAALLAELSRTAQDLHSAARPEYFKPFDARAAITSFQALLRQSGARAWVAYVDDAPVGYVVSILRQRDDNAFSFARKFIEIDQVAVLQAFRRRGITRALLDAALADARSLGLTRAELTSWAFNSDAHEAFAALGFRAMSVRFERAID